MMRPGDKLASYRRLAEALVRLGGSGPGSSCVVGDGPRPRRGRSRVLKPLAAGGGRVHFAGRVARAQAPRHYWPAATSWPGQRSTRPTAWPCWRPRRPACRPIAGRSYGGVSRAPGRGRRDRPACLSPATRCRLPPPTWSKRFWAIPSGAAADGQAAPLRQGRQPTTGSIRRLPRDSKRVLERLGMSDSETDSRLVVPIELGAAASRPRPTGTPSRAASRAAATGRSVLMAGYAQVASLAPAAGRMRPLSSGRPAHSLRARETAAILGHRRRRGGARADRGRVGPAGRASALGRALRARLGAAMTRPTRRAASTFKPARRRVARATCRPAWRPGSTRVARSGASLDRRCLPTRGCIRAHLRARPAGWDLRRQAVRSSCATGVVPRCFLLAPDAPSERRSAST